MQNLKRQAASIISALIGMLCILAIPLPQNAAAAPISGLGSPSSHSDLAGGSVIDFETNVDGESMTTFSYSDVSMTGNNVLRITDSYGSSYNVTGNSMALTTNDLTQEITFNFLSPVNAFGFNFGGADLEWRLIAYSSANAMLDELTISPFGDSNDGEWFGISVPGIASARLYNTEFIGNDPQTADYVVIDNFTYAKPVPEPATMLLMGLGLVGLAAARRRLQSAL